MSNNWIAYLIVAVLGIALLNFLLHLDLLSLIVGTLIGYGLHNFINKK